MDKKSPIKSSTPLQAPWYKNHWALLVLLVVYLGINLLTLTKYPKVHDDEGFLATFAYCLERNGIPIIHPNMSYIGVFENLPFIPLSGILFYSSLALIGHFFGFDLFSLRFQPLIFSLLSLVLTYKIADQLFRDKSKSLLAAFFLATSTLFLTTAHMVRQESMLIAIFLGIYYLLLKGVEARRTHWLLLAAFLSGSAISIHPNGVFFPPILLILFFLKRKEWGPPFLPAAIGMLFSMLLGSLIFVVFDYLPYRGYYWEFARSPFIAGFVDHSSLFLSPIKTIQTFLLAQENYFWNTRYHQNIIYFFSGLLALLGGLFTSFEKHKQIITIFLFFVIILLSSHPSPFYFAYVVPFLAILLSSVVIDLKTRYGLLRHIVFRTVSRTFMVLLITCFILHPLLTLWSFRNYNFAGQISRLKSQMNDQSNYLASSVYFFGLSKERLYPDYILFPYDSLGVKGIGERIRDLNIKYVIIQGEDKTTSLVQFLYHNCRKDLSFEDYSPSLLGASNRSGGIINLWNCSSQQAQAKLP